MATKKTKPTPQTTSPELIDTSLIEKAVEAGQALIGAGKPKIEAAMAIYTMLEAVNQQAVVEALIRGANLTPMGAVTYWYNCKRRLAKERHKRSS